MELDALAAVLAEGQVAVGYRRVRRWRRDEATEAGADEVLAHVLSSDGELARVKLGPAAELEDLALSWRAALGAPLAARSVNRGQRGVAPEEPTSGDDEWEAGRVLRSRLLDPVLEAAPGASRIFVCGDDLTFLVPLDALPGEEGGERLGDRVSVVSEVSFARLLHPQAESKATPGLLALGGVHYGAVSSAPLELASVSAPIEVASADGKRSGELTAFSPIPESGREAEAVAALFETAFEVDAKLLTGDATTKARLFGEIGDQRYVHLATHGWFAPESVKSILDDGPGAGRAMSLEERVSGLAPMILCGLALAGANGGRDSLGRVAGILTAEELCSLDLSDCDLAVLSACETNVGIRRAGQGIQSLQAALYAAGAKSSITSLWKVDDAATRKLMEFFYTNLWIEEMGKADALWQAKVAMREAGHPVRDWAGWVLTGDPD